MTADASESPEIRARPDGGTTVIATFYMSRRKRLRAIVVWLVVLGVGGFLVWWQPGFRLDSARDIILLVATFGVLFALAAQAIERLFSPQPSVVARTDGVVLLPRSRRPGVLAWREIRGFELYRFSKRGPAFFTILVHNPRFVSRHLPLLLRLAFWIDRTYVGEARYFRSRADFDRPVSEVVATLEAMRERYS